ncbi:unnamed protein product [Closterium sp. Yama58-4]|nr:unnamed protein product [Closterium sp. Yama58-4]
MEVADGAASTPVELPQPDDLVAALEKNYYKVEYRNVELKNHRDVVSTVDKKDLASIADNTWVTDGQEDPMPSLYADFPTCPACVSRLLSIRVPKLSNGKTWAAVDCNNFANTTVHNTPVNAGNGLPLLEHDYLAVPVYRGLLTTLAKQTHPHVDMSNFELLLKDVPCHVLTANHIPKQENGFDCGVFICHYLKVLVYSDFANLKSGLWFKGVSALQYRRNMRADICAHAMGELLRRLEEDGVDVPSQESGTTTNTTLKEGAEDGQHTEQRRVDRLEAEVCSLKREVGAMTAGFAAIGQVLGMSREELISAGENMLQKPACAVQGAGGNDPRKHGPTTPVRPSGYTKQLNDSPDEDLVGSNTRVSLDSKFASAVGAYPCFPAHLPIPGTVPHWLLSRQQGAAVSLVQPSYPVYGIAQSGAGAHPGFTAVPKQEPLAGGEDSDEDGEGETEPGTKPTKYTGVYVEADTGKFGVKVVAKDKDGKKVTKRVGAYTTIEEAAYCYAAAAHVLRPGMGTRNSVALTPADRAALKGCTPEVLKVLVDARMWWRWRVWREAYEGVMRKAARAKKNATPAKRGRPRKESGAQGGGTAGEGEGEKAGSEDTEIVAIEPTNSRALGRLRSADAKSTDDKTDEAGRGRQKDGAWDIKREVAENLLVMVITGAETRGGETSDASPGRVGKQAAESDSPDSRSKSDVDPRLALRNRGEDVDGGDQARIESDVNAFEEEDDEDVGDAMRAMFETNTNRENADVPTNGEEVRVSAGVFRSLLKSQDESAKKVARLETLLLEALAKSDGGSRRRKAERQREPGQGCMNPKRQRRGEAVAERLCELVRVQLFLKKPAATMTFYPSSDDKTYGVCAVLDRLPHSFACLALAADKSRRADLNKTLSEWKTRAAARVRDIALPKLGFFRDERDEASPWARDNARTLEQIRERIGLGADESDDLVLSNWANDRDGMPFASAAFAACAKAAFIPKKAALPLTLKVYHLAWLEHVVSNSIMYWEQRMGRLSNSAGGNGHVVNGLKVLVKGSVSQAIRHFNPEYDEEKEEWIWGRHGLRLSACGLESMKPNAGASGGDAAGNDVQSVSVGGV